MKKLFWHNKIARRLTGYFSAVLLIFAIVVGGAFAYLFQQHAIDLHKNEMKVRADHLASMAANALVNHGKQAAMGGMMRGPLGYMKLLETEDFGDAWIVDENLNLLTRPGGNLPAYGYKDLPEAAEAVVREAFEGRTAFSEGFSSLLATKTMTIGRPIYDAQGHIAGVVLLHSPVSGIVEATRDGLLILLISMMLALLLALLLAVTLSYAFTRPLNKMNRMAALLAAGDYTARTEVKKKDEIGDLAHTLDVLSEQLHAASRQQARLEILRREFIANISHELRTPVTVLRGSLEALCDKVVGGPAEVEAYQREMLAESIYLQRLVDDLLELSRLQNADFPIDVQSLDFCAVIQDAIRFAKKLAKGRARELKVSLTADFYPMQGDYGRLRQLLIILLDNALKFAVPESVVEISLEKDRLDVSNQGPGIPAGELPYLFDRFHKSRDERNKQGTGLGLAIARQIADRHGIRIAVASQTPGKTVFSLLLPRGGAQNQ